MRLLERQRYFERIYDLAQDIAELIESDKQALAETANNGSSDSEKRPCVYSGCQKLFPDGADRSGLVFVVYKGHQSLAQPISQGLVALAQVIRKPVRFQSKPKSFDWIVIR